MNDFAVSRGDTLTKAARGFQHNNFMSGSRQVAGNGKPNDTGADYNGLVFKDFFRH
jgi:hypothetical protein